MLQEQKRVLHQTKPSRDLVSFETVCTRNGLLLNHDIHAFSQPTSNI